MTATVPEAIGFSTALARAQAGDRDAFGELVERHEAMVFSLVYHFCGERGRAEEVAQDVFLQLFRHLAVIESDAHLLFWLRQVATRRCIDDMRRRRFKAVSLEDVSELPARSRSDDPLLGRRLRALLAELPETQRAMVTLRYQEDLDPSEIGAIVGMPVNTVKSHLHRALQALRKKMDKSR
jgi:RNA polymerase sigma-70 factor (ECF subfamily)